MRNREWDVVVIGAGGSQAQAMLQASARAGSLERWLGVDLGWRPEAEARARSLGMRTRTMDALSDPGALEELLSGAGLVANLAGPYYRTGVIVLDAAIATGTDYLDICDDTDATLMLLSRMEAAREAGITALIGMGSSPGTSNVLIRAAHDYLGGAPEVDVQWSVDVADMTDAAVAHFWHCFNLIDEHGAPSPVPKWDELDRLVADFPGTVGSQTVIKLAHPEPLTIPMFLGTRRASNYGTITPADALQVAWALGYAVDPCRAGDRDLAAPTQQAVELFRLYRETRVPTPRLGSGLLIDVHDDGDGVRFSSGAETEMAEATGTPAAAGIQVLLSEDPNPLGVVAPETLSPRAFFDALGRVSRGGGGLKVYELKDGKQGERIRMRELLQLERTGAAE